VASHTIFGGLRGSEKGLENTRPTGVFLSGFKRSSGSKFEKDPMRPRGGHPRRGEGKTER